MTFLIYRDPIYNDGFKSYSANCSSISSFFQTQTNLSRSNLTDEPFFKIFNLSRPNLKTYRKEKSQKRKTKIRQDKNQNRKKQKSLRQILNQNRIYKIY
jgi:hypothetical protein